MKEEKCCGECCWHYGRDPYGYGGCPFLFGKIRKHDMTCDAEDYYIGKKQMRHYLAVLLQANRYRRDNHVPSFHKMPRPTELCKAIDFAYKYIKTFSNL